MRKRKMALPEAWPGYQFTDATIADLLAEIGKDDSQSAWGERFALGLLKLPPGELKAKLDGMENDVGNTMLDLLTTAETSLKTRHAFVTAAIARVAVASGVVKWSGKAA